MQTSKHNQPVLTAKNGYFVLIMKKKKNRRCSILFSSRLHISISNEDLQRGKTELFRMQDTIHQRFGVAGNVPGSAKKVPPGIFCENMLAKEFPTFQAVLIWLRPTRLLWLLQVFEASSSCVPWLSAVTINMINTQTTVKDDGHFLLQQ